MNDGYVVSDLHIGAGADDSLEDFSLDGLFATFVRKMGRQQDTLLINGDFVDFAQIEPLDVKALHPGLIWDEATSVKKLEVAIAGHPECFVALRDLIALGGRLCVINGNHDLDFAWPAVQQRLAKELGAEGNDHLTFVVGATSFEGVHIEHGYAFTVENSPHDPSSFIRQGPDGRRYLERVWGTDFLLRFFIELEKQHKYTDNVKPTIRLAWQALRHRWIPVRALVQLAVAIKRSGIPWGLLPEILDDTPTTPDVMLQAFSEEDWQQLTLELVSTDTAEIQAGLDELDLEDRKFLVHTPPVAIGEQVTGEPAQVLGLFRAPREERAAKDRLGGEGITHVVFGHTHDIIDGELDGRWFNPGSWIPHLDLRNPEVKGKVDQRGWSLDLLSDARLYETKPRAVRIRPNDGGSATVDLIDVHDV